VLKEEEVVAVRRCKKSFEEDMSHLAESMPTWDWSRGIII